MEEIYGVDHYSKSHMWKDQIRITSLEVHGAEHWSQTDEWKEKTKQTYIDRYGVEHHTHIEGWKEKQAQRNLQRMGYEWDLQRPEIKAMIANTQLSRYSTGHHRRDHISHEILDIMKDKDKMTEYYNERRHLSCAEISNEMGVSHSFLLKTLSSYDIEVPRNHTQSAGEREVIQFLEENDIPYISNTRRVIAPKEIDIYIPEFNLAIEYNGLWWHDDEHRERKFHQEKSLACEKLGMTLIHIYEHWWDNEATRKIIKDKILYKCKKKYTDRIYARKCKIVVPNKTAVREFYNVTHIQGHKNSRHDYALEHNGEIEAVISLSKTSQDGVYEIDRYATKNTVVGGFSKLLKFAINDIGYVDKIVTYSSLDYSHGDMYTKTGFVKVAMTPPNYFYYGNGLILSRYQCMKHKLKDLLGDEFDEGLTEYQNMRKSRFGRVYDSGSYKFEYVI